MGIKLILGFIVALTIAAGLFFYFGSGLEKASVKGIEITGLEKMSAESVTIVGSISVENPSQLSVPIERIEYDVILEDTGERISSGSTRSFTLAAQEVTDIPFTHELRWVPTASLAARLATQQSVYATIKGEIYVGLPGVDQYGIPFSTRVDLKPYIMQFTQTGIPAVDEPVQEVVNAPAGVLDTVAPEILS